MYIHEIYTEHYETTKTRHPQDNIHDNDNIDNLETVSKTRRHVKCTVFYNSTLTIPTSVQQMSCVLAPLGTNWCFS